MSPLIISADQKSGTYRGRKVVAVSAVSVLTRGFTPCEACVCNNGRVSCGDAPPHKCMRGDRVDGTSIVWRYATANGEIEHPDTTSLDALRRAVLGVIPILDNPNIQVEITREEDAAIEALRKELSK